MWERLGQPKHYIEPFFGSGVVLLNRPGYEQGKHIETVNDKDAALCNVWRALQYAPDEVARWCDWPVNHADLSARKKKIIEKEDYLLENLIADPEWYDARIAGYWIWSASCWIGSGLTSQATIPHLSDGGMGVHSLLGQRPHLSNIKKGVQESYNVNIYAWFRKLSERLRYVRVVCGDWTRVCGGNWQDNMGVVGMFFDPPYGVKDRCTSLYHHDSTTIANDVLSWVRERGQRESYRIVLAGYEEYQSLLDEGWTFHHWKAVRGYSNGKNKNRFRETLYFSPHCVGKKQAGLGF